METKFFILALIALGLIAASSGFETAPPGCYTQLTVTWNNLSSLGWGGQHTGRNVVGCGMRVTLSSGEVYQRTALGKSCWTTLSGSNLCINNKTWTGTSGSVTYTSNMTAYPAVSLAKGSIFNKK